MGALFVGNSGRLINAKIPETEIVGPVGIKFGDISAFSRDKRVICHRYLKGFKNEKFIFYKHSNSQ